MRLPLTPMTRKFAIRLQSTPPDRMATAPALMATQTVGWLSIMAPTIGGDTRHSRPRRFNTTTAMWTTHIQATTIHITNMEAFWSTDRTTWFVRSGAFITVVVVAPFSVTLEQ